MRSELMQCGADHLQYDFPAMVGRVWLPHGNACDMGGCTKMFTAIDPNVRIIHVHTYDSNGVELLDTVYKQDGEGKWFVNYRI